MMNSLVARHDATAERWVGSARRELLNHVIVFNEQHLRCLLHDYVAFVGLPRVGGLHHRYVWREAA